MLVECSVEAGGVGCITIPVTSCGEVQVLTVSLSSWARFADIRALLRDKNPNPCKDENRVSFQCLQVKWLQRLLMAHLHRGALMTLRPH